MKKAIILQHLDRESPGQLIALCNERGLSIEIVLLGPGILPPNNLAMGDLLIVMGGSMGVGDRYLPQFSFLNAEIQLLKDQLAKKQPVLGICLGAQLLASAAGARVFPNVQNNGQNAPIPMREVGFGNVLRTDDGEEPIFAGLDRIIPVLHWHGDTFDLPMGATHLAKSERCQNQAFRLEKYAVGLQFHPEVDEDMVRAWVRDDADFAVSALGPKGPQQILAECKVRCQELYGPGRKLLGNILDQLLS